MLTNKIIFVLILFIAALGTAGGATIFVPDDYTTVQGAIDSAWIGDVVVVRAGTYVENVDFLGKAITVESESGPALTVIDGNQNGSVVLFNKGEGALSILDGFTLTNGSGTYAAAPFNNYCGGGIFCDNSFPTIRNTIVDSNNAVYGGGVCFSQSPSAVFVGNQVSNNTATAGGGIFCRYSDATIEGNTISNNDAGYGGGGLACWLTSAPTLTNNIFYANTAGSGGGGAIRAYNKSAPVLVNNTIVGNSTDPGSGGAFNCKNASITVTNSIIWDNDAPDGTVAWIEHSSTPSVMTISHSDLEGGQASVHVEPGNTLNWNTGMIDSDPLFVDSEDFHLTFQSPCRNSGDNTAANLPSADFEDDARVVQGTVDMGADEYFFHLYTVGTITAGSDVSIRIVGWPGSQVRLCQGNQAVTPQTSPYGDFHLVRPVARLWSLGAIPSNGVLIIPATVPDFWAEGDRFFFQSLVGSFGGASTRLTNLLDIVVK